MEVKMILEKNEIPYFIKIEGCNNCKVSQAYVTKTGTLYENGHTLYAKCIHMGCDQYGHSLEVPFITPKEYVRIGTALGMSEALDKAKKIIVRFFDFYDTKGNLLPWVIETISQENIEKPIHIKVAP